MDEFVWNTEYKRVWARLYALKDSGHSPYCPDVIILLAHSEEIFELGQELGYMLI